MTWIPRLTDFYNPLMAGSIDGTDDYPHDRAISRAMTCRYKPNPTITGDAKNTLFFARINPSTVESTLENLFVSYGKLVKCKIVRDIISGCSKCYGFVEFHRKRDADEAWHECNGMMIDGSKMFLDYECGRTMKGWIPRRFGGGLGGKKESGQLRFGGRDRPFRRPISMQVDRDRPQFQRDRSGFVDRNERYGDRKRDDIRERTQRSRDRSSERERSRDRRKRSRERNDNNSHRRKASRDRSRSKDR